MKEVSLTNYAPLFEKKKEEKLCFRSQPLIFSHGIRFTFLKTYLELINLFSFNSMFMVVEALVRLISFLEMLEH